MWQLVLFAAVTGSGILVKRLFNNGGSKEDHVRVSVNTAPQCKQKEAEENVMEVKRKEDESVDPLKPNALVTSSGILDGSLSSETQYSVVEEEEAIFTFSSLDRGEGRNGSRSGGSKGFLKKGGIKGNVDSVKSSRNTTSRVEEIGRKLNFMNDDQLVLGDQRRRNKGIKFSVCLNRRRISNKLFRKCRSCSSNKGNSSFSYGVGVELMYMLSAGKAEINKLNVAIEDNTKVVSNLQSELCKRKLTRNLQDSNMETLGKNKEPLLNSDSVTKLASPDDPNKVLDLSSNDDGECASSILTEEAELEALNMDKLEAELESELQKIPDQPDSEYFVEFASTELSAYAPLGSQEPVGMGSNSFEFYGVSPTELDRKLCHLFIKQQESQIAELESNLYLSQMKLSEKEAELQTLKNVVRCLRDFSLETASDDETEDAVLLDDEEEEEMNSNTESFRYPRSVDNGSNKRVVVTEQKLVCGVKRAMEFESFADCQVSLNNAIVSECGL